MILKSMRARLGVLFSLCLATLMVITIFGLIWYSRRSAERSADNLMAATAQRIVSESDESAKPADLISEEREDLRGTGLAISIVDSRGQVLVKTQRDAPGLYPRNSSRWRIVTSQLKSGDTLVVGIPWAKTSRDLRYHAITLIFLGAFVVVIASAGAWFLVGRALRPIPQLARQARASSVNNLAVCLEPPSQDREMIELVETLNSLLRRVTATAAAKGRFYSAASHELRTPLQALSGHLELALSRDREKEEYRAVVVEAHAQTRRLVSLVRSLLQLYQLDSSTSPPSREPVELVSVCERVLSNSSAIIAERGLQVETNMPKDVEIYAPASYVEMLVRNLIENAVRYTSEHGRVSVTVNEDAGSVRLEVVNDCAEPPKWEPDRLFEPFSRPDASRNVKTGGTGLGLAICKAIADTNGWMLNLQSESARVRVSLVIPRGK